MTTVLPQDGPIGTARSARPRRIPTWRSVRRIAAPVLLAAALVVSIGLSFAIGSVQVPLSQVLESLGGARTTDGHLIVMDLRMPRTIAGLVAGTCLAIAGVLLQGATRNPLASPTLLGITSGAGFAVVLTVAVFGMPDKYAVWAAFIGGAGAALLALTLASSGRDGMSPVRLALSGSLIALLLAAWTRGLLALNESSSDEVRHWLAGSLAGRDATVLPPLLPALFLGLLIAFLLARPMDALALGDEAAVGLGQRPGRVRVLAGLTAVTLSAVAVAMAGPIAFVGLIVPHLVRFLVGNRHSDVLLSSALAGPVVLLLADVVGRIVAPPTELQAGVLTAFIGAPVLVLVAARSRIER